MSDLRQTVGIGTEFKVRKKSTTCKRSLFETQGDRGSTSTRKSQSLRIYTWRRQIRFLTSWTGRRGPRTTYRRDLSSLLEFGSEGVTWGTELVEGWEEGGGTGRRNRDWDTYRNHWWCTEVGARPNCSLGHAYDDAPNAVFGGTMSNTFIFEHTECRDRTRTEMDLTDLRMSGFFRSKEDEWKSCTYRPVKGQIVGNHYGETRYYTVFSWDGRSVVKEDDQGVGMIPGTSVREVTGGGANGKRNRLTHSRERDPWEREGTVEVQSQDTGEETFRKYSWQVSRPE